MIWSETEDRTYKVAKHTDPTLTRYQVKLVMRAMRAVMFQAVEDHEEIFWPGMFRISYRDVPERRGWNPSNQKPLTIPAHTALRIKWGDNLKVAVGQKETTKHYERPEGWWKGLPEAIQREEEEKRRREEAGDDVS